MVWDSRTLLCGEHNPTLIIEPSSVAGSNAWKALTSTDEEPCIPQVKLWPLIICLFVFCCASLFSSLRCADPAGGVQEAGRPFSRLQPLLRQEEQAKREEKILQHWAVLPNVRRCHFFTVWFTAVVFACHKMRCRLRGKASNSSSPPPAGGQESGRSAAAAVTAACRRGRSYVKGGFLHQKRKSWMTQPATPHVLHSLNPAATTPAPPNGWPWTGQRWGNISRHACILHKSSIASSSPLNDG